MGGKNKNGRYAKDRYYEIPLKSGPTGVGSPVLKVVMQYENNKRIAALFNFTHIMLKKSLNWHPNHQHVLEDFEPSSAVMRGESAAEEQNSPP